MDNAGQLIFGVRAQDNSLRTLTSAAAYNDNQWHQVTATMGAGGMRLYVDGVQVGQPHRHDRRARRTSATGASVATTSPAGRAPRATCNFVNGYVDEVAIYPTALSLTQILAQYQARPGRLRHHRPTSRRSPRSRRRTNGLSVSVNGTGSSDPDGTITGYSWNWGDGTAGVDGRRRRRTRTPQRAPTRSR